MFAYTIVYDLVAEEDDDKREVAGLLDEVIGELADALSTGWLALASFPGLPS